MILGLGIDSVEISRFEQWHTYSKNKLLRFFSATEVDYCLKEPQKAAERFAVRFSTKEALLKALSQAYPEKQLNLLHIAKNCQVLSSHGIPELEINFAALKIPKIQTLASLTHTRQTASAAVIIHT